MMEIAALVGGDLKAGRWRSQYWRLHGDLCKRTIEISTMEGEDPGRNLELEIRSLRAGILRWNSQRKITEISAMDVGDFNAIVWTAQNDGDLIAEAIRPKDLNTRRSAEHLPPV
jgi:hypothetical protein